MAGPNAPGSTTPDVTEPYTWTPANSADVTVFYNALSGSTIASTATLRDYTLGSAAIAIAASSPREYADMTGSAMVAVD